MRCLSALGNLTTASILLIADLLTTFIRCTSHLLVDLVDRISGSGSGTARNKLPWIAQRFSTAPVIKKRVIHGHPYDELDVEATLMASSFPIGAEALVERAKAVLASEFGTADGCDPNDFLSADFQFVAPIVGPLLRDEFVAAFGGFRLKDAVPDLLDQSFFQVDPVEPNRVWFFGRAIGTHTGPLKFGPKVIKPTGKAIKNCPQASSILFQPDGLAYTLTVGYCMDKRIGNSEGLGGLFGILKAVDSPLPIPEGRRLYNPSLRIEAFERVAKVGEDVGMKMN